MYLISLKWKIIYALLFYLCLLECRHCLDFDLTYLKIKNPVEYGLKDVDF